MNVKVPEWTDLQPNRLVVSRSGIEPEVEMEYTAATDGLRSGVHESDVSIEQPRVMGAHRTSFLGSRSLADGNGSLVGSETHVAASDRAALL